MNEVSRIKLVEKKLPPGSPPLRHGQRLTQAEFHRRYEAYPNDVKFELIGGIVYLAPPVPWSHGQYTVELGAAFSLYDASTPGVEAGSNATVILGKESEPQPDQALRILPEYGGQSRLNEGEYVEGAPELLAEVAYNSRDLDLNQKRDDYQRAGVVEYLVLCVAEQALHWFDFRAGGPLRPNSRGVWRSKIFPGLWLDGPALLARDSARLIAGVQRGLASREHAAFIKRLQAAHRRR
ncbi:MAG TPA: Uma2 family endonuclease [Gemmataceae bacterium]|nr:Uma2 family endonuclease [Gemmataceae bacterium]